MYESYKTRIYFREAYQFGMVLPWLQSVGPKNGLLLSRIVGRKDRRGGLGVWQPIDDVREKFLVHDGQYWELICEGLRCKMNADKDHAQLVRVYSVSDLERIAEGDE